MLDVIVYLTSAGPNLSNEKYWNNCIESINSISDKSGDVDYKFYIVTDNKNFANAIGAYFLKKESLSNKLLDVCLTDKSWAKNYNNFFNKHSNSTKYILISHDDVIVKTDKFLQESINVIEESQEHIGWVSFTNDRYYNYDPPLLPMSNSFKDPFALDRKEDPCTFECHNFEENIKIKDIGDFKKKIDLPDRPVKAHGPYSHLNLISVESMRKVGLCEDWTEYTILIDDDWNLEALKNNLYNVWIPQITYTHPNPKYNFLRVPGTDLRFSNEAHSKFIDKWGFDLRGIDDNVIEFIRKKYKNTNIPKTSYKKTYEWDYLK